MHHVTILTESELRQCVDLDTDVVDIVERAFVALATKNVVMPPILSMAIAEQHGEVDVKTAYVPGFDEFAIKVSPGFFDNPKRGLPSLNGLMIALDARTGIVKAVLLDNGYLTDIRTAAAGAVAARHLAPARVQTVGIIGAGRQAELQVRALRLVRDFSQVLVWARDPAKAAAFATRLAATLQRPVSASDAIEEVVRASDVVVTTTPARQPLLKAEWLHPGLHITAMGSDAADKCELDPKIIAQADCFVCDRRSQSIVLGELRMAVAGGVVAADHAAVELGEICAGVRPGRRRTEEITVCDLTGTGIQDTAIATHALASARARGCGCIIEA